MKRRKWLLLTTPSLGFYKWMYPEPSPFCTYEPPILLVLLETKPMWCLLLKKSLKSDLLQTAATPFFFFCKILRTDRFYLVMNNVLRHYLNFKSHNCQDNIICSFFYSSCPEFAWYIHYAGEHHKLLINKMYAYMECQ